MSKLLEKMGFGKKPDIKEQVRQSKREIMRGTRDIDRELSELKREEAKLVQQIKLAAKSGNEASVRILAKSLVRLRGQMTKMVSSKAQLQGVATQITTAATSATVAKAVGSAAQAMGAVQTSMQPQAISKTMQGFAKENAKMQMAGEMMDDAIDGALDEDDMEDETGALVDQVLDEIGVSLTAGAAAAPTRRVGQGSKAGQQEEQQADDGEMAELQARLAAIKG